MFRVLVSVSDKTGLPELIAGLLAKFGQELMVISTGGTHKLLKAQTKLEPHQLLEPKDFTGVPEVMDGRVKTIHPKIAGGILARRDVPSDMKALRDVLQGFPIDMVVVNLYPFQETAKKPSVGFDELVEQIDIGGPSLVRAAAKNFRDVLVVIDQHDYEITLQMIASEASTTSFRFVLAMKAFAHTAGYDAAISKELGRWREAADGFRRFQVQESEQ